MRRREILLFILGVTLGIFIQEIRITRITRDYITVLDALIVTTESFHLVVPDEREQAGIQARILQKRAERRRQKDEP